MPAVTIRKAAAAEAPILTQLAFAAKRHWGYPEEWIQQWAAALTITPDFVTRHPTFCAEHDGTIVGFGALRLDPPNAVLEHLWVLPTYHRRGVGTRLFRRAESLAQAAAVGRLSLVGDPHATDFYRAMGASLSGYQSAPVNGHQRRLPVFEKALASAPSA